MRDLSSGSRRQTWRIRSKKGTGNLEAQRALGPEKKENEIKSVLLRTSEIKKLTGKV